VGCFGLKLECEDPPGGLSWVVCQVSCVKYGVSSIVCRKSRVSCVNCHLSCDVCRVSCVVCKCRVSSSVVCHLSCVVCQVLRVLILLQ